MPSPRATPEGEIAPADVASAGAVMRRAGGENFPVAMRILPPRLRRHLLAIYGFARLVDQLGDDLEGDRDAALAALEADVDRIYRGEEPRHEAIRPLPATIRAFAIPRGPFDRLIAANRQDQQVESYRDWDELLAYCDLSANPVGELVLHVLRAATSERIALSDAICTGLQLAEHWQDVREDLVERGRVYVPEDDRVHFGVTDADLRAPVAAANVRALVQELVDRARRLLDEGRPLLATLSGWGRIAVAGYVGGGYATLAAIERADCDVLQGAPTASKTAKLRAARKALRDAKEDL